MSPSGPGALDRVKLRMVVDISGMVIGAFKVSNCVGDSLGKVILSRKACAVGLSMGSGA